MVIGQSGGPTAVINQSLVGAILAARQQDADITGILGSQTRYCRVLWMKNFIDLTTQSAEAA